MRAKYTHCTNLAVYVNEYFALRGSLKGGNAYGKTFICADVKAAQC